MSCNDVLSGDPMLRRHHWRRYGYDCGAGPCMDASTAHKENII